MDDDIDIEEHDLLDNPTIQNMFPDLSILKKEISGYLEEAPGIKKEPDITQLLTSKTQECNSEPTSKFNNLNNDFWNATPGSEESRAPVLGNKIILGSKPIQTTKIESNTRDDQDPYAVKVLLNDIKSSLENSERFCKICLIMFPQKKTFELHKNAVHGHNSQFNTAKVKNRITIGSILKNYMCTECSESFPQHSLLRRHLINAHRKKCKNSVVDSNHTLSPLRMRMSESTELNQCFHCKISFSSKKLLIEHIYMVLQSKKGQDLKSAVMEKQLKNQMKTTLTLKKRVLTRKSQRKVDFIDHTKINDENLRKLNVPIERKAIKPSKSQQNNLSLFQCVYCSYYFSKEMFYFQHLKIKHRDTNTAKVKTVKFDKQCKYCLKKHDSWRLHNSHIYRHHREKLGDTSGIQQKAIKLTTSQRKNLSVFQCAYCSYYFSKEIFYFQHLKIKHRDTNTTKPKAVKFNEQCKYCLKKHFSWKVHNVHLFQYHREKLGLRMQQKAIKPSKSQQNNLSVFQCVYCSYYFSDEMFYYQHLKTKHKDTNTTKVKAVKFNEQCKYCLRKHDTWRLHNSHMYTHHREKLEETIRITPKICLPKIDHIMPNLQELVHRAVSDRIENSTEKALSSDLRKQYANKDYSEKEDSNTSNNQLVLKSMLFKCKRCDIHFLSAKSAMNHADHMELLINWKCLMCNKILKKVDEKLHLSQHNFSDSFTVLELTETQLERILYKCTKCTIHFDENGYMPHLNKCEILVAESAYCKICDILIDKCIVESHRKYHSIINLKQSDFTILNSDVIGTDSRKTHASSTISKIPRKKGGASKFCFRLSYCKTCNSFISKRGNSSKVHMKGRCAHLPTYICKICGLVLTNKSMATHKLLHKERKGIRLKDFTFHHIFNGKQIQPSIPEYPKCKTCQVHFISRIAVINHICNEDFLTCLECNIKLSEPVFKLHMSYHYYSKNSQYGNDLSNKHSSKTKKISEEKRTLRRPRPPPKNRERSVQDSDRLEPDKDSNKSNGELNKQVQVISQNDGLKYLDVDNFNKEDTKSALTVSEEGKLTTPKNIDTVHGMKQVHRKSDLALFNVLYCCINCRTNIDTYDGVVEHCQKHLCDIDIEKLECKCCGLQLDKNSYESHKKCCYGQLTRKSYQVIEFDTFYFSFDHKIWLQHIFQNLDSEKSRQILNRSIYKYGGKIKMQVIQEGPPDLTVYKCNSCFVIVDPESLLKHVENSCFKTRKHLCSYCGLPFMSYMSLKNHLNIHIKKTNVSLKSYRIVVINQKKDKENNKMISANNKYFLLYMCRKCKGVMDTYQHHNHTFCNDKDLKKCLACDLLVYSTDFKPHIHKHEWVRDFVPMNMKIILFGQGPTQNIDQNPINLSNFDGMIVDFSFIKCVKCGICIEKSPIAPINHHTCYEDSVMTKCSKCDLNILKTKFARHTKLHDANVHFVKKNINIIPYDHNELLSSKFVPAHSNGLNGQDLDKTKTCHLRSLRIDLNSGRSSEKNDTEPTTQDKDVKISERTTKLFKCICGLHFLDETSINEHFGSCKSEKSKQNCSKCHLLFTPTVLFSHLLLHHGDKKYVYNFNIIQMSNKKNVIVVLYNCVKCKTHFLELDKALEHFGNCKGTEESERKECAICSLYLNSCSIAQHEALHHDEKVAYIEIVDVNSDSVNDSTQNKTDGKSIDDVIEQADLVRESKYNISEEYLSQLDLSRYSNTIFKCEICNTHFLTHHTFRSHFANGKHILSPQDTCSICELQFSLPSLTKHVYIHHKQMKLGSNDLIIVCN